MRKMPQHRPNMAPRPSKREVHHFVWRSPRWPVWLPKHQYISPCTILSNTLEEDPRALWRFADQRGGPIYKLCCSKAKSCQAYPKSVHSLLKRLQILPNSSPNPSQTVPKPFESDPKSIQKASWGPSWTNAFTRYDFESQKKHQNAPKSDHKAAQSVPNPSQIEPNTFQNQIFGHFFAYFFWIEILHRFFINFFVTFTFF